MRAMGHYRPAKWRDIILWVAGYCLRVINLICKFQVIVSSYKFFIQDVSYFLLIAFFLELSCTGTIFHTKIL